MPQDAHHHPLNKISVTQQRRPWPRVRVQAVPVMLHAGVQGDWVQRCPVPMRGRVLLAVLKAMPGSDPLPPAQALQTLHEQDVEAGRLLEAVCPCGAVKSRAGILRAHVLFSQNGRLRFVMRPIGWKRMR